MYDFNPGTNISCFTSLGAPVNGENVIFLPWNREENNKCSSSALKPTDPGCILLAVLFPSIRGALCRSSSSGCSQLCFGGSCCSRVRRSDYLVPASPLSTSKGCYWSSCLVPGTSVLQIWWESLWQLFLRLCGYLGTKILQKLKVCLHV